jgi:hypothetical protein
MGINKKEAFNTLLHHRKIVFSVLNLLQRETVVGGLLGLCRHVEAKYMNRDIQLWFLGMIKSDMVGTVMQYMLHLLVVSGLFFPICCEPDLVTRDHEPGVMGLRCEEIG